MTLSLSDIANLRNTLGSEFGDPPTIARAEALAGLLDEWQQAH